MQTGTFVGPHELLRGTSNRCIIHQGAPCVRPGGLYTCYSFYDIARVDPSISWLEYVGAGGKQPLYMHVLPVSISVHVEPPLACGFGARRSNYLTGSPVEGFRNSVRQSGSRKSNRLFRLPASASNDCPPILPSFQLSSIKRRIEL